MRINEHFDAAGDAWLASDESLTFERKHHLVNRRRADLEIALHVDFGRGPPIQSRIGIDKCQVLTLLLRKGFGRETH